MIATIAEAMEYEPFYRPHDVETLRTIGSVTLAPFVGPTGVGKNFNMNLAEYPQAGTITTREPRPSDHNYRYFTEDEMIAAINKGLLVQYGVYGPHGPLYGSDKDDYTAHSTTVSDMTHDSVEALYCQGFKDIRPIGILAPPNDWEPRLDELFATLSPVKIEIRLAQAADSVQALIESYLPANDRLVIESAPANSEKNRKSILEFINTGYTTDDQNTALADTAQSMLEFIPQLKKKYL